MTRRTFVPALLIGLIVAIAVNGVLVFRTIDRVRRDEQNFISSGVQATTCLLEVFAGTRPFFENGDARSHEIGAELESFLILQRHRYGVPGARCPSPPEARLIAKGLHTVR